jgi:hypothetical protein
MNLEIFSICGPSDIVPDFEEIGNDPNYVFINDPDFSIVQLFDIDGNIINVNSWIECANYVNGGWTNNLKTFINYERNLFFLLSFCLISYGIIRFFYNRRRSLN